MPEGIPDTREGHERKRPATIAMNKRPDICAKRVESNRRRITRGIDPPADPDVTRLAAQGRIGGKRQRLFKLKDCPAGQNSMRPRAVSGSIGVVAPGLGVRRHGKLALWRHEDLAHSLI